MKLKAVIVLLGVACAPSIAYCDDASKLAKVDELFRLTKIENLMGQMMDSILNQAKSGMAQQLMGVKLTPERQKEVDAFQDQVGVVIADAFSWEKLKVEYAKLYADAYSEDELDGIIAFYKTPSGQALVEKSPALLTKSTAISQQHLHDVQPQLRQMVEDFMSGLKDKVDK